ncbi:hypothetical protein BKA70DRAFT_1220327 [Coprinopsis sp. MPI-PUGE-AT-0042]|nr:hypothetical protein BKA70DRAFT_1220327 [Coprinopsis sp. MPI-PUGE-AT-0042]
MTTTARTRPVLSNAKNLAAIPPSLGESHPTSPTPARRRENYHPVEPSRGFNSLAIQAARFSKAKAGTRGWLYTLYRSQERAGYTILRVVQLQAQPARCLPSSSPYIPPKLMAYMRRSSLRSLHRPLPIDNLGLLGFLNSKAIVRHPNCIVVNKGGSRSSNEGVSVTRCIKTACHFASGLDWHLLHAARPAGVHDFLDAIQDRDLGGYFNKQLARRTFRRKFAQNGKEDWMVKSPNTADIDNTRWSAVARVPGFRCSPFLALDFCSDPDAMR